MADDAGNNPLSYDAVVVLAHLMEKDGTLGAETRMRVDKGAHLATQTAYKIVFLGWDYRADSSICISDAIASYVMSHHSVPSSMIIIDRNSRDTVGDAIFSKRILGGISKHRRVMIVTSDYHVARALRIFRYVYGEDWVVDATGVPATPTASVLANEIRSQEAFERTFSGIHKGDDEGIFSRLVSLHPFYNGEIYMKIEMT
jgi:uncharacterized SAM-binding protein YcdF (DUF218 family)